LSLLRKGPISIVVGCLHREAHAMRDALVISSNADTLFGVTGPPGSPHDQSGIGGSERGTDDQQRQNTKESSDKHSAECRSRKGMKPRDGDYQSRFVRDNDGRFR
jgi:hypothetical protein